MICFYFGGIFLYFFNFFNLYILHLSFYILSHLSIKRVFIKQFLVIKEAFKCIRQFNLFSLSRPSLTKVVVLFADVNQFRIIIVLHANAHITHIIHLISYLYVFTLSS